MSQTHQIDTVQHDERAMSISWIDGHRGRYLHIWLRDNCMCDECGTSISGQRRLRLSDIPETIKPSEVIDIAGSQIKITWPDGHETRYEAKWLRAHCHCAECRAEPRLRLQTWDASLNPESLVQTFEAVMDDDACLFDLIATIVSHGLVRVRGVPEQSTAQLASRIGYLHDTNYGLLLDMKTEASSWFRVMSAEAIPPHTDNVYRYDPTGVTFFHCVQQISGGGGASRYVDAFRIAESLRVSDPDCFDCLSTTPLRFHRHIPANADLKVDAAYFKTESPVFKLDQDGQVIGVRYHPRTLAPLLLDEAEIARVYRSRMKLETLSVDPSMRIEFVSDPGECAIYDNHRVMHSRTGFEGANGVSRRPAQSSAFVGRRARSRSPRGADNQGGGRLSGHDYLAQPPTVTAGVLDTSPALVPSPKLNNPPSTCVPIHCVISHTNRRADRNPPGRHQTNRLSLTTNPH